MFFLSDIKSYVPQNEQEKADKEQMLNFAEHNSDCLLRSNKIAHFTASAWIVNRQKTQVLFVFHNLYKSWSWVGGHADGENDLFCTSKREAQEETGIKELFFDSNVPISLETLTVPGHIKHGSYVSGHLHFNITYLFYADNNLPVFIKPDENSDVRWLSKNEALTMPNEPWMTENIYKKLIERTLI